MFIIVSFQVIVVFLSTSLSKKEICLHRQQGVKGLASVGNLIYGTHEPKEKEMRNPKKQSTE